MGKPTGFKEIARETPQRKPVKLRLMDWHEIYEPMPDQKLLTEIRDLLRQQRA